MPEAVPLAQRLDIRQAGYDEYWLQDQIYEKPACLGIGELVPLAKERLQSSGGRLDILLKNPDDDTMYEVEVMLGATDETHIVRTIEYWDNEQRRWPQRQHYAVLVAEHINRRFFNVIYRLSHSIPIIAIQALLLSQNGSKSLYFAKVLDTYEEVEDIEPPQRQTTRADWQEKAPWTLETADSLLEMVQDIFYEPRLNYTQGYIAINVAGYNYFALFQRSAAKSLLTFRMRESLQDATSALLNSGGIVHKKTPKDILVTVDRQMVERHRELLRSLATNVKNSWQGA